MISGMTVRAMESMRRIAFLRRLVEKSPLLRAYALMSYRILRLRAAGKDIDDETGMMSTLRLLYPNLPLPDMGTAFTEDAAFRRGCGNLAPERAMRVYNLYQLAQLATRVEGDFAECGCYRGASAYFLAKRILQYSLPKKLCLFDSFAGLSRPGDKDGDNWNYGDLSADEEDVRRNLAPLGETPFVEIYRGWIPERFDEVAERKFSFVHMDLDLYEPTRDSLKFFWSRLSEGGIILFDDYGFSTCPGVTRAVNEFMESKPEPIVNFSNGAAFVQKSGKP